MATIFTENLQIPLIDGANDYLDFAYFNEVFNKIDELLSSINTDYSNSQTKYNEAITKLDEAVTQIQTLKDRVTSVSDVLSEQREVVDTKINGIDEKITNKFKEELTKIESKISTYENSLTQMYQNYYTSITNKIESFDTSILNFLPVSLLNKDFFEKVKNGKAKIYSLYEENVHPYMYYDNNYGLIQSTDINSILKLSDTDKVTPISCKLTENNLESAINKQMCFVGSVNIIKPPKLNSNIINLCASFFNPKRLKNKPDTSSTYYTDTETTVNVLWLFMVEKNTTATE